MFIAGEVDDRWLHLHERVACDGVVGVGSGLIRIVVRIGSPLESLPRVLVDRPIDLVGDCSNESVHNAGVHRVRAFHLQCNQRISPIASFALFDHVDKNCHLRRPDRACKVFGHVHDEFDFANFEEVRLNDQEALLLKAILLIWARSANSDIHCLIEILVAVMKRLLCAAILVVDRCAGDVFQDHGTTGQAPAPGHGARAWGW
mmetsp:Transcript_163207/g.523485  ORF Transcript_163207/g.523485 Transcript_163207/m.523485 type:complete len:203 (+) Transcript_163207:4499-5107(+)